jgi:hypothetical protein
MLVTVDTSDSTVKLMTVFICAIHLELEVPDDLARLRLPAGVQQRLTELLDRQDTGTTLSDAERHEAEGLVDLAELLSLLRLRSERMSSRSG